MREKIWGNLVNERQKRRHIDFLNSDAVYGFLSSFRICLCSVLVWGNEMLVLQFGLEVWKPPLFSYGCVTFNFLDLRKSLLKIFNHIYRKKMFFLFFFCVSSIGQLLFWIRHIIMSSFCFSWLFCLLFFKRKKVTWDFTVKTILKRLVWRGLFFFSTKQKFFFAKSFFIPTIKPKSEPIGLRYLVVFFPLVTDEFDLLTSFG